MPLVEPPREEIAKNLNIDIWKHMSDAGDKPVPWKPQYSRGGYIFTCPVCGYQTNSHRYTCLRAFEDACQEHMNETHFRECIHWDARQENCELEGHRGQCFCEEFDRRTGTPTGGVCGCR